MKKLIYITLISVVAFACSNVKDIDRSKPPVAGPAPQIKIGGYQTYEMANGLKVFVVENHKLPRVSFQLSYDVDPVLEGEYTGYLDLTGSMLRTGTTTKSKSQLDEEIDFLGAGLNTSSRGIFASSLKKHQDKLLALMSDVLLNPSFSSEELDKLKKQSLSGLSASKTNADEISSNVSRAMRYGKDHPYGEITTEESLEKITIEKCKEYYNTYMRPNVSYLVIVGDITLDEAKPLAEKYFGSWKKADVPEHKYNTPKPPQETQVDFVDKVGAVQSVIAITYPVDLKPGTDDAIKASVMNSILGGGVFSGRLMQNLREDKAYTYGARSSLSSDPEVGNFRAFASVRNSVTDSSVTEFMNEMYKMVNDGVTQKELDLVKNNMNGLFALSLERPQTIARFALNIERYNLPKDYYDTYLQKLNKITVEDVNEMAKKYIKPTNAHIVVVGNKDEVSGKLAQFSKSGKVNFYDIYGEEVEELKPVPAGVTANSVMDDYITARGGKDKLEKVKDLATEMSASISGMPMKLDVIIQKKAPNKYLFAMKNGGMVMQQQVFDGTKAKMSGMMGSQDITGEELEALKLEATPNIELKYAELGYELLLKGIEVIDGKDVYKMEVTNPFGDKAYHYFDVASKLKVREVSTQESPQGAFTTTMILSDYKEVDGILFAHTVNQNFGGQEMSMRVTAVKVNAGIKDSVFEVK